MSDLQDPSGSSVRTIGVLTSGGDCAGLNAVIRAVSFHAIERYGWTVLGVEDGTLGLIERPRRCRELRRATFDANFLRLGGTMLGTVNKGDPFHFPMPDGSLRDRSAEFAEGVRELGLDALVAIGGDGSMRIVSKLCARAGLGMVGIPKTIDNDVHGTDYAVGFSTALDVATEALDRLQPTAASHHRVMVLELMGRDAGHIALNAGIAGGADIILIPELRYTLDGVCGHVRRLLAQGRDHALVVAAEGVATADGARISVGHGGGQLRYGGIGDYLRQRIAEGAGVETRLTVLGHVQRGGVPSPRDRLLASTFGVAAVDCVARGRHDRMVVWRNGSVMDIPLSEVTIGARAVPPNDPLIQTARGLGIYVGEDG